jgi:dTDP-4-amino-4,6-dideoxygalactose transaminase
VPSADCSGDAVISRTKANYSLRDLWRAARSGEDGRHKERLLSLLRSYTGQENILLTPSGRGGLYFILRALQQRRVLVPSYTCKAVVEAILFAGKLPVHIEVEAGGFNMDTNALARALDQDSIVVATHQFGIPCAIDEIMALAAARGAVVVEDAAASLGTRVGGRLTGTFGDAAFFSFDSTKLVNVPMKAGFVVARDRDLFERIVEQHDAATAPLPRTRKWLLLAQAAALVLIEHPALYRLFHWLVFQSRGRYTADSSNLDTQLGAFYRYALADWQASIAALQVAGIDALIEKRHLLYRAYMSELAALDSLELPPADAQSQWACVRFPIRVRGDKLAYYRRAAKQGIDFAFSFTYLGCPRSFERAWRIADSVLDVPFYSKLELADVQRVARVLSALERPAP